VSLPSQCCPSLKFLPVCMKYKKVLKSLDKADSLLAKLAKLTLQVYRIVKVVYDLYRIVGHHYVSLPRICLKFWGIRKALVEVCHL
jgi:hypothetical protein